MAGARGPTGRGARRAAPQRPATGVAVAGQARGEGEATALAAWDGTALAARSLGRDGETALGRRPTVLATGIGAQRRTPLAAGLSPSGGARSLGHKTRPCLGCWPLGEGRSVGRVAGDLARAAAGGDAVAAGE
jgi:hypothetical protein